MPTRGASTGMGGDFLMNGCSEPLDLSIPHARNFLLCLSNLTSHDGSHTLEFSPAYSRC